MKSLKCVFIVIVLLMSWCRSGHSSCKKDKEEVFVIKNYFQNRVFADGKEATAYIIDLYSLIYGYCIPHDATVIAVMNVLSAFTKVSFFGSVKERLLTNDEWKCVDSERSADWYQPWFNDTDWPNAYSKKPLAESAFISKNAQAISSINNQSNNYFCRGRMKKEPSSRSAMATRTTRDERLVNHLIQSFLVNDILECLAQCLHFDQCVSMNYEENAKMCELNSETKASYPQDMDEDHGCSYYNIIKQYK